MKSIIEGLRFDTEKATLIGEASHGNQGDFSCWEAGLYKTPRSGRYFLAGRGGPMTMFRRTVGTNEWSGGEKIIPVTEAEAFEWAQRELPDTAVETHFGHLIEEA